MQLKDSETFKNLARAFAGECMAKARYDYIVYGAKQEGYSEMAKIIKQVANQEFHHSRMFYSFIQTADKNAAIDSVEICAEYPFKEKWNLVDNLKFAADDENEEATRIYPAFAETARKEGFKDIAGLFDNVVQVETCHNKLFTDLYNQLSQGKLYCRPKAVKWKCADCGYEATSKEAWKVCPLCQAKQGAVMLKLNDNN